MNTPTQAHQDLEFALNDAVNFSRILAMAVEGLGETDFEEEVEKSALRVLADHVQFHVHRANALYHDGAAERLEAVGRRMHNNPTDLVDIAEELDRLRDHASMIGAAFHGRDGTGLCDNVAVGIAEAIGDHFHRLKDLCDKVEKLRPSQALSAEVVS